MCQERIRMKKLKEVLRLKLDCSLKNRAIARAVNLSASTVSYYTRAFAVSGLSWPLPATLSDTELIDCLEPHAKQLQRTRPLKQCPDFALIHQEMKRKGVTLQLLYEEYQSSHSSPIYSYSEYCRRYREWKQQCKASLRQTYRAGEKCFVDYAGPRIPIYDAVTGMIREAYIFIGVLGASNYTFAEATWSRSIPDWLGSHQRMFLFFNGVPHMIIPDNEKAGVTSACYYDPELNPHYLAFATHYQTVVLPTRPKHPRDKAKVETAVQIVERWILARLRHCKFYSLVELNQAISDLLKILNKKPFKKLPGCRLSQFEQLDKPALKTLPSTAYEHATIKCVKVRLDYHIEVDNHYYSVPHQLIAKTVEYQLTENRLEIYYGSQRVASHLRSRTIGGQTLQAEHMPHTHRAHQGWTPRSFLDWAIHLGQASAQIAEKTIATQPNTECCYRIYLGLRNLVKRFGAQRFENACQYALVIQAYRYRSIKSILEKQLDRQSQSDIQPYYTNNLITFKPNPHIRGGQYYQTTMREKLC